MQQLSVLLSHHGVVAALVGLALIVMGILLRWVRRRPNVELHAESRGVVVNGDNPGTIITGDSVDRQQRKSSSRDWIDISGAIVAILGAIIAGLAYLLPRAPQ